MVKNALVPDPEGELLALPQTASSSKGKGKEGKRREERKRCGTGEEGRVPQLHVLDRQ